MNYDVILTCAVTGGSDIIDKNPGLPSSPAEIAAAAIEAVKAGAAVAHIHVREPETGAPSRDLELYKETAKLIRESDVKYHHRHGRGPCTKRGKSGCGRSGNRHDFSG